MPCMARAASLVLIAALVACKSSHDAGAGPEPSAAASIAPSVDPTAAARAQRVDKIKTWTPAQRMTWVKHCLSQPCADDEVIDVTSAAATTDEIAALGHVGYARIVAHFAALGVDGDTLSDSAIQGILQTYRTDPAVGISLLPHTTRGAAMKDIVSERGKYLTVSGTVLQIQRDGDAFWATLFDDAGNANYLITALDADGVDEHTRASFEGVAVQRYTYSNTIGGATQSLLVVGAFMGKVPRHVLKGAGP
jgi:hypothetical protein